jgi:S-adenosylmethionine:tRNA ribosyltransferase-isomerase
MSPFRILNAAVSRMKSEAKNLMIGDYDYQLPQEKIAEFPLQKRDGSKLLVYKKAIIDDQFYNLHHHIPENSTLILNDTKVIEARILFTKATGGVIEIFCLEPLDRTIEQSLASTAPVQWQCLIGGASKWKTGQVLQKKVVLGTNEVSIEARYIRKLSDSFAIEFSWNSDHPFAEVLHAVGAIPLPPYIKRNVTEIDKERYQTIFNRHEGSVAAPTAALHFTEQVFQNLEKKNIRPEYVTLHVGAGTFKPVKTASVAEHEMHREPFTVSVKVLRAILASKNIIAVGTTSLRTLESIYWLGVKLKHDLIKDDWALQQWEVYDLEKNYQQVSVDESLTGLIEWLTENGQTELHCQTSLIIIPGYQFKIPAGLITNFHQPQSTLLLLIAAFIGEDWKKVYQHALENNYRFLSYGDSSLLWRT